MGRQAKRIRREFTPAEAARYRPLRWNVQPGWEANAVAVCSDREPLRVYTWRDGDTESVAAAIWWDWCDPSVVEALS